MIVNKLLTPRGWRVVADSMLAASGVGLLYLLSGMVIENIQYETLNWWTLGVPIVISLWLVALGSMLARAELTNWS